ncbi:hypothetical protein PWEIH_15218 [Listeria weihenstephanensis FSL R9-0317]|uniref:BIG2 domain-containing protein n=1 Tax=Listeria weihenstephanensis TaxID=1006155 RepID=A0A1S7FTC4_9LIST|nr:toxin Cry1Ac domain D-VI-related protein [Listeria weihenstephanensis]AQY50619.1 hypothetical protein UE46_05940 [Listeria weihenstephanensis]EUJ35569.1 hypothetical protein PWEIH_15218 [Listeria weihenstephanensis FSL R9-0317]
MNKNMKKIALALVATNVVASTIITALPPVQTHAAEQKLTSTLKSSSGSMLDYVTSDSTKVTGRVPAGAGKQVTVQIFNARTGAVRYTFAGIADESGDYSIPVQSYVGNYLKTDAILVTFDNGKTAGQSITIGDMSTFKLNTMKDSDTTIKGVFTGHPNVTFSVGLSATGQVFFTTDAEGNFSFKLPDSLTWGNVDGMEFAALNASYYFAYRKNPTFPVATPAVSFNVTGLNTAPMVGATGKMSTNVLPATANQGVTYSSSNPGVMTVDGNGNWAATGAGTANIIVTSNSNNQISTTIPVTVGALDPATVAAVNDLFINNNPANHIKDTTDQAAINAAQAKVNAVTDTAKKAELQGYVTKAQNELNARTTVEAQIAAAKVAFHSLTASTAGFEAKIDSAESSRFNFFFYVNGVYSGNTEGDMGYYLINSLVGSERVLKGGGTLVDGDVVSVKLEVNGNYYPITSATVSATYDAANVAVNGLFIENNRANHIKDTTDQAAINAAQAKVNAVTDATKKAELQTYVTKAQNELNARIADATAVATASVNDLFINNNPANHIKDATDQAAINAAQAKVNAVTDTAKKAELQGYVTKAQNELNARIAEATASAVATASVNDLFINSNPANHIKDTTDQAAINAAQAKVNAVTDTAKKAELQGYVTKAQNELNARIADNTAKSIAFEAVNNLFINNNPIYPIKDTTNQAAIDAAQAKVNVIVDPVVRGDLQKQIDQAKAELAARTATEQAKASVNNLFANAPTNTILKDTTTQAMIDAASAQVNALPASTDKTKLQGDIATANTLFGQITQTTIAGLTSDATTVSGKGEPNSNIVIKNGSATIASGKVASDGNYLFFITPQAGGSTITATVTKASNGKTSSASTKVVDETIVATTINSLSATDVMVSGKGEPNSDIVIKNGSATIASGKVASDGNYLFFIAPQAGGSTITATVTKASNGKMSTASTTIPDDSIVQTTINTLKADSTTVSGVGEPNSNIVIKNGTVTIASGKTASDGSYTFNIAKQAGGSTITATVTKASNGKTSTASTTIADETIATTTINDLTANSTTVSGSGEPNSDIIIKNGNTTIASGKTASNGTYLFNITPQAAGSTITATITKASNGKVSTASTLIPAALDYSLKANSYKIGTANLTGTYGKNIAKVRLFVNDKLVIQATTSNGTFTFPNIASFITKPTDKVEVVGVDGGYVERARVAVTVTGDPVYDYSLTANDYTLGNATLTGKYGKDVSKVRLWVNNVVVSQATTNADGTYTFDKVPSFVKLATDKVEVVGVNAAYNEVARKTVVTKGSSILDTSLTANNYAKGAANLTGTFGKDISKVRLWVNGAVVQQATTNNGNYTFTNIASFIKNKEDLVEVVGVDAQYNEKNRITVTKTGFDTLDNSLTAPADFTLNKDTAINGTMGTNVANVRLSVNGVIVKQAAKTGNTYSIAGANTYITSTTDVVKIIAVDAQYKEVASKNVTVKADSTVYDYTFSVDPYTFGASTITGAYGKDITSVRLWINGVSVKIATLNNGNFTISGLGGITSTSDLVEIVAVNASFKEVARVKVQ